MTRLKNKFFLILAGIVGLCCSFCAFIMPKKVDVASAETVGQVQERVKFYYVMNVGFDVTDFITNQDENNLVTFIGLSDVGNLIFSTSFIVTFRSSTPTYGLLCCDETESGRIVVTVPYFISSVNETLVYVQGYVNRGNEFSIFEITDTSGFGHIVQNQYSAGYNEGYNVGYEEGYGIGFSDGTEEGGGAWDSSAYDSAFADGYEFGYNFGYDEGESAGYDSGYDVGYEAGESAGYDSGYDVGYEVGESAGYDSGYDVGYEAGETDGFDGGYALGKTDGQKVEYITQNRGLWGDRFEFSWEYEGIPYTLNFALSTDDAYEVFIKGGMDFSKLQLVFREWCTLEGFHIPDVDATLITVKCPMVTNSLNPFVLWTGDKAFVGDGYYLCDGNYKWGSFQNIDEQYELSDVYEFETFSEMTVAPDSLTFTFQSSWDFFVYANDGSIGFTDYNVGYNQGFGNGYEQGYDEGYDEGDKLTSESLQNAYNDGYSVGISKAENFDFAYAVSTVIGAPVTVVKDFLNFELLGVNLLAFISGIITLLIIVKCIKFFL